MRCLALACLVALAACGGSAFSTSPAADAPDAQASDAPAPSTRFDSTPAFDSSPDAPSSPGDGGTFPMAIDGLSPSDAQPEAIDSQPDAAALCGAGSTYCTSGPLKGECVSSSTPGDPCIL